MGNFFTTGWNRGIPQAINAWGQMAAAKQEDKMAEPLLAEMLERYGGMFNAERMETLKRMPARKALKQIGMLIEFEEADRKRKADDEAKKAMEGITRQVEGQPISALNAPGLPPMFIPGAPPGVPMAGDTGSMMPTGQMTPPRPPTEEEMISRTRMAAPSILAANPALAGQLLPFLMKPTEPPALEKIAPGYGVRNPITGQWEVPVPAEEKVNKPSFHYYTHRDETGQEQLMSLNEGTGELKAIGDPSYPAEKKGNFWYYSTTDENGMEQRYQLNEDTDEIKAIGKPAYSKSKQMTDADYKKLYYDYNLKRKSGGTSIRMPNGFEMTSGGNTLPELTLAQFKQWYDTGVLPGGSTGSSVPKEWKKYLK